MATATHVKELFCHYSHDADICIVEGMMGLFDGYHRDQGSSAEIALTLGLPVVLVVDARSAAYSLAAQIYGFLNFRKDLNIVGIIFNKVGSEALEQGSRYLGLDFSTLPENEQLIELLEAHVDWKRLSHLFSALEDTSGISKNDYPSARGNRALCVARNAESFSFIYQETLDRYGETYFFDPETEEPSLNDIDLLYLPGGYPEKHLEALVSNEAARTAIKAFAERGGNIIAECGGMMYLCEKIITDDGEYPMLRVRQTANSRSATDSSQSTVRCSEDMSSITPNSRHSHHHQFRSIMPKGSL